MIVVGRGEQASPPTAPGTPTGRQALGGTLRLIWALQAVPSLAAASCLQAHPASLNAVLSD